MGTFITRNNWLTRLEGAALFGWGTSITGPKASRSDDTSQNYNREYFIGWPQKWVVKKFQNCGGSYGNLRLEVKTRFEGCEGPGRVFTGSPYETDVSDAVLVLFDAGSCPKIYDSYEFANGDDHVYSGFSYNLTMPGNEYREGTCDLSGSSDNVFTGSSTGGHEAYLGNGVTGSGYSLYVGDWSGKMTPADVLDYASGSGNYLHDSYYNTETTTYFYAHDPIGSHWSQTGLVTIGNIYYTAGVYDGYDYLGDVNGTTFLMDEDWTATGRLQKTTCKFRWKYHPEGGAGCKFWEGVQVEVKVLYKKAAVTKTDGPDGVFYSIGTWASAGNNTQTVTLHDKYSDEYVGTEVTMPTEEGYIYIIDDVEILTVTLP